MKGKIHFETVRQYFENNFDCIVEDKRFHNSQTGETYFLICDHGTDIAFFTVKPDGTHICLDSNGEDVNPEKVFAYVNGDYVQGTYENIAYDGDKLEIRYDGQEISMEEINVLEERIYPKSTNIILNNMFSTDGELESVCINEIAYVDKNEFDRIMKKQDSDVFEEYNARHYEGAEGCRNGILVINKENGDGLVVDTQGFGYARYMSYAPKIQMPVEYMLEKQMKQDAVHEMKLYVPLEVTMYDEDEDHEYEVGGKKYYYNIKEKVAESIDECGERGLAKYFWDDDKCRNKVYSIKPDVEIRNNQIMGVAVIKMTKPLFEEELESLKDYVTGQFSDGWGEGFEQHEIAVGDGEIYVHFWNSMNYYIHTEAEQQEYEMNFSEPVHGMQEMNMSQ